MFFQIRYFNLEKKRKQTKILKKKKKINTNRKLRCCHVIFCGKNSNVCKGLAEASTGPAPTELKR